MELKFSVRLLRGADRVAEKGGSADVHVYVFIIYWVIWSVVYCHVR